MVRGLKFWIQKVEGLYYLCSENKAADQLRGSYICPLCEYALHRSLGINMLKPNETEINKPVEQIRCEFYDKEGIIFFIFLHENTQGDSSEHP